MAISKSVAEKAIQHFSMLEKKCNISDSAQREMAMIYRCAVESIKMMQNPKILALLKEGAKNMDQK